MVAARLLCFFCFASVMNVVADQDVEHVPLIPPSPWPGCERPWESFGRVWKSSGKVRYITELSINRPGGC